MNDIDSPFFSVVIPTYNHGRYLGRALQSVFDQTYKNLEIIVIDNHSTDNTDQVMASFVDPRITYLKIKNNGVIAGSRNAGIRVAKGEWIAFLDSDDWWTINKLQVCCCHINEQIDLIYHDLEIVRNPTVLLGRRCIRSRQVNTPALNDLLSNGNAINTSSTIVRKKLLDQIGGMCEHPDMIGAEDYNTWLRIANLTNGFEYIPERLGFYQMHDLSVSRKDMSVPIRHAIAEYRDLLTVNQEAKLDAILNYTSGRFNYLNGNYVVAKDYLLMSVRHGQFSIVLKVLWMKFVIFLKL